MSSKYFVERKMRYYDRWPRYVPVAERREKARKQLEKQRKKGKQVSPVQVEGRTIAKSFWGKRWCDHLESMSDYENRLPRGRTYVRNGSVCHLEVKQGAVEAMVSGSSLYSVSVTIKTLVKETWEEIKQRCAGQVGSLIELLQGKLSSKVMEIVADQERGLFPKKREISFDCSCPDSAGMCKHIAAVLYGIGNRLDHSPELLFQLRGVDPSELLPTELPLSTAQKASFGDADLGELFGIDIEMEKPKVSKVEPIKPEPAPAKPKIVKATTKPALRTKKVQFKGSEIGEIRKHLKMSASEFGESLGLTPATIYRWEKFEGVVTMHPSNYRQLVKLVQKLKMQLTR
jgi:uncharacterized Zn finger protein